MSFPQLKVIDVKDVPFAFRPDSSDPGIMQQIFHNGDYILPIKNFAISRLAIGL